MQQEPQVQHVIMQQEKQRKQRAKTNVLILLRVTEDRIEAHKSMSINYKCSDG